MLYQLGKYNTKDHLSNQAKRIRDHILINWDFESTYEIVKEYNNLEFETVLILKKGINAGHWNSIYGLKWTSENEIKFWTTVQSKSPQLSISKHQLLRTQQSSGNKEIVELFDDYIDLLDSDPELYYTLMSEDLEGIWKENERLKCACLNAMFTHLALDMDFDEFSEEVKLQLYRHYPEGEIPHEINENVTRIKIEKTQH